MWCGAAANGGCCRDFPNWSTFYGVFRRWRLAGLWQQIHDALRQQVRKSQGKKSTPTAAIIDSQSVRTAEGGEERGDDAGKKITGRKRHLAVDTLGLVLTIVVHGGSWQDHDGACFVLMRLKAKFRRLKILFADSAYAWNDLPAWVRETFGWVLQTVLRPAGGSSNAPSPGLAAVDGTPRTTNESLNRARP